MAELIVVFAFAPEWLFAVIIGTDCIYACRNQRIIPRIFSAGPHGRYAR